MRVTLIFPGIYFFGFGSKGRMLGSETEYMNHGLAYVSSYAKSKGHEVDLIDMRELDDWEQFEAEVGKRDSAVFGIGILSNDYEIAKECCRRIKAIDSSRIIVAGGVHPTVDLLDVSTNEDIDHIITGEGEISFTELLGDIEAGRPSARVIPGVSPNLDDIPWADRDLFGMEGELNMPWFDMPTPFVTINMARGCPYKCNFCQPAERSVFGGAVRRRSLENVMDELCYLRDKFHFNSFMVHDDLFTINPKWVMKFCDAYEEHGFTAEFCCQVRVDHICKHEYMMARLKEIGLRGVLVGFESGSQRLLDFMEKGTTVEENVEAAKICHKYGIEVFANIMFGIPTETRAEAMMTARMVRKLGRVSFSPSFFMPYKGAGLYDYVRKHDMMLFDDIVYGDYDRAADRAREIIKGIDYDYLHDLVHRLRNDLPLTFWERVGRNIKESPVIRPLRRLLNARGRADGSPASTALYQDLEDAERFRGRSFTLGCWVHSSTRGSAHLALNDGQTWRESRKHSGSGQWEYLTVAGKIGEEAESIRAHLYVRDFSSVLFDSASLTFGATTIDEDASLESGSRTEMLRNCDFADWGRASWGAGENGAPESWILGGDGNGRVRRNLELSKTSRASLELRLVQG